LKRISVLWASLCLVIISSNSGYSLPITVEHNTRFSTTISTTTGWSDGERVQESRSTVSSNAIHDYTYKEGSAYPQYDAAYAGADAELFEISAYAGSWISDNYAFAASRLDLIFAPLMDGSETLEILFLGYYEFYFSSGYVSLFDNTLDQEMWNYGWSFPLRGNVPWISDPYDAGGYGTAALSVETNFIATHSYALTMYAEVGSNGDRELITVKLSGLEARPIPEPATLILLASGLLGMAGLRRMQVKS